MRSQFPLPSLSVRGRHFIATNLVALLALAPLLSAEEMANNAKNIARLDSGATITRVSADRSGGKNVVEPGAADLESNVLISADPTASYALPEGETTFVLAFPNAATLDRFTFVNENALSEGDLSIAVSNYRLDPASPKWVPVDGAVAFTHKRFFNLSMVGVEAHYVRLSFHVQKAGRIASLSVFSEGSQTTAAGHNAETAGKDFVRVSNTNVKGNNFADRVRFDFAKLTAKSRVVYVSSGPLLTATRMIDNNNKTSFQFAPDDKHPTVIIELAKIEQLNRVSALVNDQGGQLDIFLLNELKADRGDLSNAKPVASYVDRRGDGKAMVERDDDGKVAVDFDPEGARYVALRWTPEMASRPAPFEIAEVNAFGQVEFSMLDLDVVPETFAMNMSTAAASPQLPPFVPVLSP